MTSQPFSEAERDLIERTMHDSLEILGDGGMALGSPGMVYLLHHRETSRRIRSTVGRKPLHEEIAQALLAWARVEGAITLYALRPIYVAMEVRHGPDAAKACVALHAPLALAHDKAESFLPFMRLRMNPRAAG